MTSDRAGPPGDIWILKPMRGVGELLYYTHTDMIHAGESSPPELDLFSAPALCLRGGSAVAALLLGAAPP